MVQVDQFGDAIVINGFENGIGDSPYDGITELRNINIDSVSGEADINFKTVDNTPTPFNFNITSASGSTISWSLGGTGTPTNGQAVYLTGVSLPTGLTAGTATAGPFYWINSVDLNNATLELFSNPVTTTPITTTSTGTGTATSLSMGTPKFWTYSISIIDYDVGYYFIVDKNGRVWGNNQNGALGWQYMGNKLGNATGLGIVWYQGQNPPTGATGADGYLFSFHNATVDYMDLYSGTWTYGWINNSLITENGDHYALNGEDNAVYYTDGNYVGSFFQTDPNTAFDPATSSTYTWDKAALALPTQEQALFLEELNGLLLVSGIRDRIYPWDRVSTSYNEPIKVGEPYIPRMVTLNAKTYLFAGTRGRIYVTNGSQADLFTKLPDHLTGIISPYFQWEAWGATRNHIYFGVRAYENDGTTAISGFGGLWKINVNTGALTCANTLSYDANGTHGGYTSVFIPNPAAFGTMAAGGGFFAGYVDAYPTSNFEGIDASSSDLYENDLAYVISDMIAIGTKYKPITPSQIEYKLSRPLLTGESVKVYIAPFFTHNPADFSLAGTTNGDSSKTILSDYFSFPLQNLQWLMIKVVLNGIPFASIPSYNRLTEIRIHGGVKSLTSFKGLQ
ncbi:MAG: hypothetical protein KGJ90_04105 [Patescibacteria group bacterium]|nr:hypothetical protein [Patescibacteria group bacterium]